MMSSTQPAQIPLIEWKWDEAGYLPAWHEPIYELMDRYVPKGCRVLEVGAGGSHTLAALAGRSHCHAFGIEPDCSGIDKTNQLASDESGSVTMIRGDGFCLPFDDGVFDVVYSLGLIEHFSPDESIALTVEHARVCREGGLIIVAAPNFLNLPHTLRKWVLGSQYEYFPERSYTPGKLKRLTESAGTKAEVIDGVSPLWGLAMIPGAWRLTAALDRLSISKFLNGFQSPEWRARSGYMTYVIGRKQPAK